MTMTTEKPKVVNESIKIEVEKNRLKAYLAFLPPQNGGQFLKKEDILNNLKDNGIKFGVLEDQLGKLALLKEKKPYNVQIEAAIGIEAVNGVDGRLEYTFDITGKQNQPKILEDGTVDYKQIDYFLPVRAGQLLANRILPIDGQSGTDVFGNPVQYRPGKPPPKFSRGKNVYVTEDELELKSQISGQLVISGKTIGVTSVLNIKGDVGYETGNIDFEGSVIVSGNVLSGFKIIAAGNVEVKGVVEAAEINAGGAINLYGGLQAQGKGTLKSNGNVFMKFAENANIEAFGNITANAILHSKIICKGSIHLEGDNGLLVGGTVVAGGEIKAKIIGSSRGTKTEIKAGNNPDVLKRYKQATETYMEEKKRYDEINTVYEDIMKIGNLDRMDNKQKRMVVRLINDRREIRSMILDLEDEITQLLIEMKNVRSTIVAEKVMYDGVIAYVSDAKIDVDYKITSSVLKNVDGIISVRAIVE